MANTQFNSVDGYAVGNATIVIYANSSMVGNVITASSNVTAPQLISNVATGTAPLTVTSTTRVANLNVAYANVSDYGVVTTQTTGVYYPVFVNANTTANYAHASNAAFSANLANGALIATTFVGALSGAATSATTAGTVTTAAQPNITSVGTLTSLAVTGNTTSGNFIGVFANGNSSIAIPSADGNINLNAAGNATPELVVTATGVNVAGTLHATSNANVGNLTTPGFIIATGNIRGGNLITTGLLSVTGNANVGNIGAAAGVFTGAISGSTTINVTGNANVGNLGTSGLVVATGNVTGGNLVTGGVLSVTGNANVGNLGTAGLITATGNITGGNLLTSAAVIASTLTSNIATGTAPLVVASTTKVTNLNADLLDGYDTATANTASTVAVRDANGNISANFFIGNGSQLTGISAGAGASISNGTSNVNIATSGGNITMSVAGVANVVTVTSSNLQVGTGGGGNISGANVISSNTFVATGNVTGSNIISTINHIFSVQTGISAGGTVVGNATAISKDFNVVSTVNSGTGVSLPTAVAGMRITVINTSANTLNVYPLGNGIINSQAANAAYSQPAGSRLDFICTAAATAPGGQWYTLNATYG